MFGPNKIVSARYFILFVTIASLKRSLYTLLGNIGNNGGRSLPIIEGRAH